MCVAFYAQKGCKKMIFRTSKQVVEYIQANPDVTFEDIYERIPANYIFADVLLETIKYVLFTPALFKSEKGASWERAE